MGRSSTPYSVARLCGKVLHVLLYEIGTLVELRRKRRLGAEGKELTLSIAQSQVEGRCLVARARDEAEETQAAAPSTIYLPRPTAISTTPSSISSSPSG